MKKGYMYIMSNRSRTTLYVGVTSDIERRILEHKAGIGSMFTRKYKLKYLLYYESFQEISQAIEREKQLKRWHKEWKWNLIKEENDELSDLAKDWFTEYDIVQVKGHS